MKAYLIEYWSDSCVELTAFNAENIGEAKKKFWSTRDPDSNQIFLISESDVVDYKGDSSADSCSKYSPENPSDIAPYGFGNEIFSSRRNVECLPISDGFYFSRSEDRNTVAKRMFGRIKDLFGRFFGKFD